MLQKTAQTRKFMLQKTAQTKSLCYKKPHKLNED